MELKSKKRQTRLEPPPPPQLPAEATTTPFPGDSLPPTPAHLVYREVVTRGLEERFGEVEVAEARPANWAEAETAIRRLIDQAGSARA